MRPCERTIPIVVVNVGDPVASDIVPRGWSGEGRMGASTPFGTRRPTFPLNVTTLTQPLGPDQRAGLSMHGAISARSCAIVSVSIPRQPRGL